MYAYFQNNPEKFVQVLGLLRAMTKEQAAYFLNYQGGGHYGRNMARALGVGLEGKSLALLHDEIWQTAQSEDFEGPVKAFAPDEIVPVPTGVCDGCLADTDLALRWGKVIEGEAIKVSADLNNAPPSLLWLTPELIFENWLKPWMTDSPVKFELSDNHPDVRISFAAIDSLRGMKYSPILDSPAEIAEAGDLSGNWFVDMADRWITKIEVNEIGQHMAGCVLGLRHTMHPDDIMYGRARGFVRPRSVNDNRQLSKRYET